LVPFHLSIFLNQHRGKRFPAFHRQSGLGDLFPLLVARRWRSFSLLKCLCLFPRLRPPLCVVFPPRPAFLSTPRSGIFHGLRSDFSSSLPVLQGLSTGSHPPPLCCHRTQGPPQSLFLPYSISILRKERSHRTGFPPPLFSNHLPLPPP